MTKIQKLNYLSLAQNSLQKAAAALRKVRDDKNGDHYLCEDARHFCSQVESVLSSDHGQAGLQHLIETLERGLLDA